MGSAGAGSGGGASSPLGVVPVGQCGSCARLSSAAVRLDQQKPQNQWHSTPMAPTWPSLRIHPLSNEHVTPPPPPICPIRPPATHAPRCSSCRLGLPCTQPALCGPRTSPWCVCVRHTPVDPPPSFALMCTCALCVCVRHTPCEPPSFLPSPRAQVLLKNFMDACIAALSFWLIGYAFAFGTTDTSGGECGGAAGVQPQL